MSTILQTQGKKTILIVTENEATKKYLKSILRKDPAYQVCCAASGAEALKMLDMLRPHLLIVTYRLRDMSGIQLYDAAHQYGGLEHLPALFVNTSLPKNMMERRNIVCLSSPYHPTDLLQIMETVLIFPSITVSA